MRRKSQVCVGKECCKKEERGEKCGQVPSREQQRNGR